MRVHLNANLEFIDSIGSTIKENFKPIVYIVSAIALGILLYQCYRYFRERPLKDDTKVEVISTKEGKHDHLHEKVLSPKGSKKGDESVDKVASPKEDPKHVKEEPKKGDEPSGKVASPKEEKKNSEEESLLDLKSLDVRRRPFDYGSDPVISDAVIKDEDLIHLTSLPGLKPLNLGSGTIKLTDEDLERWKSGPGLKPLNLGSAFPKTLTDQDVENFAIASGGSVAPTPVAPTSIAPAAITFENLVKNSDDFAKQIPFKTEKNLIKNFATTPALQAEVVEHAKKTTPILHMRVYAFIIFFLKHKQKYGSPIEQEVYKDITPTEFINRLIKKRPVAFFEALDSYMLRDGTKGEGGFEFIGTANEKEISLKDYQSYSEMSISAFLSMFVPTHFINEGGRSNRGVAAPEGTFEPKGIYAGMVGARFERPDLMEWAHMVVSPKQNTIANGYGVHADPDDPKTLELRLWAELYRSQMGNDDLSNTWSLPTYVDAVNDKTGRFLALAGAGRLFLDTFVYKEHLRLIIEPFLLESNDRCGQEARLGYLQAVGLGLGFWALDERQTDLMTQVYAETIAKYDLKNISDLDFSWFQGSEKCGGVASGGQLLDAKGHAIHIHFSKRNPAAKLDEKDKDKLLIAQYPGDSNAFPGNEYWLGSLDASGDPAAACCSFIPELQNPYINPHVDAKHLVLKG